MQTVAARQSGAGFDPASLTGTRILFLVTEDHSVWTRRLGLIRRLRQLGAEVWVMTRLQHLHAQLKDEGFNLIPWSVRRDSLNPFRELRSLWQVLAAYRRVKPDLVHHFSLKPMLYGTWAAQLCGGIPVVNTAPGLGHVFTTETRKIKMLRRVLVFLLRISWKRKRLRVTFQNRDNLRTFVQAGIVDPAQTALIRGSGVDCNEFAPHPEPPGAVVLLAGRMLWEKGIASFVEAATLLKSQGVQARFLMAGEPDESHPSSIPRERLQRWSREGCVEWLGEQRNMPALYAAANIVCLPSYGEGVPKALIEAAASGRAVVATDVPGCREVVRDGENGLLVPVRDSEALAAALGMLLASPGMRARMGKRGRELALSEFSEDLVIQQTIAVYRGLLDPETTAPAAIAEQLNAQAADAGSGQSFYRSNSGGDSI